MTGQKMTGQDMTVIVTDVGFGPEHHAGGFVPLGEADGAAGANALDLPADADISVLAPRLPHLEIIRIAFESFADGRGFTLARLIRLAGYTGRLRAAGHVLADQYAMARRAGFDEVEISAELASRQPEAQWRFRADWRAHDYQSRLRRA